VTEPRDESLHQPEEPAWEEEPLWTPPVPDDGAGAPAEAPPGEGSRKGYRVSLPAFEGPLDLLLHLIRVNEINVYDIPIAEVTRQYLVYLDLMRDLHLEVAAEYLVMAATLAYIKSKTMLPAPPRAEQAQEDPRSELRDLLLEYQRVKSAAAALRTRDEEAVRTWGVGAAPPEASQGQPTVEVSLFDLLAAFQRVLASIGEEARLEFRRDTLRVADAMRRILDLLELAPALFFDELLVAQPSRASRIVVFLALLELVRLQTVRATQARLAGHILLWRRLPRLLPAASPPAP
jgi:segregation and condensation protein A